MDTAEREVTFGGVPEVAAEEDQRVVLLSQLVDQSTEPVCATADPRLARSSELVDVVVVDDV
jgi:hypothetical protein